MELKAREVDELLAYWDNKLPADAQINISERLRTDPDFRQAADETQLLVYALRAARARQTSHSLSAFRAGLPPLEEASMSGRVAHKSLPDQPLLRRYRSVIWSLAAALAGILVFWLATRMPADTYDSGDVARDYFNSGAGLQRKSGDDDAAYRRAIRLCTEGQYGKALPIFRQQFEKERDTSLLLQMGIAAMGAGQYDQAAGYLEAAGKHIELKTKASWYLALTLLERPSDHARAIQILQGLVAEGGKYGEMAKTKLKAIAH